jgi:hypothetical protein
MFRKINTTEYVIDDISSISNEIKTVIDNINVNKVNFAEILTNDLFDVLLSRKIASLFAKDNNDLLLNNNIILIKTIVDDRTIKVTVGAIKEDNKTIIVNGVLRT